MKNSFILIFLFLGIITASAQTGIVKGKIYDKQSSEPLAGASVTLLKNGEAINGAYTDEKGEYILEHETGSYQLVATYMFYVNDTFTLELQEGKMAVKDFIMNPDVSSSTSAAVEIVAKRDQAATGALMEQKIKAIQTIDGVSSEAIKRSGDVNVATAMQRITAVTVEGGKYVYVRGLGDRYSKTLLNGSDLPGLDPDRNTVQMDIFPSALVDRLVVYKTFTPDLPGSFTGGLMDIITKDFPEKFTINASASLGYNTQGSLNKNFLTYQGGKLDFLGFDDGTRAMPSSLVNQFGNLNTIPGPSNNPVKATELDNASKAFSTNLSPYTQQSFLNQNYSFSVGNQTPFLGKPLGFFVGISYRNAFNYYDNGVNNIWYQTSPSSSIFSPKTQFNQSVGYNINASNEVLWGALANLSWQPSAKSKIALNYMRNQSAEDYVRSFEGIIPQDDPSWKFQTRTLGYTQRALNVLQLKGNHALSDRWNIDWNTAATRSSQNEPDLRFFSNHYTQGVDGQKIYEINKSAYTLPSRYFRNMTEWSFDAKLHIENTFKMGGEKTGKFKFGGAYNFKMREFKEYRLQYVANRFNGNPDDFFLPENLGVVEVKGTEMVYGNYIENVTESRNSYTGTQHLPALYAMTELPITTRIRFIGGVRPEFVSTRVESGDKQIFPTLIKNLNVLPATTFIYNIKEKMNLRANYTQTVARGALREFAPFSAFAFVNGNLVVGNPDLKNTLIHNTDLRWEVSPRYGEIVNIGVFHKKFINPIEIVFNTGGNLQELTWRNVGSANSYGLEFEFRKKLDFVDFLKNFQIGGNVALIKSVVEKDRDAYVSDSIFDPNTAKTRAMYMQSPYVVNADIVYSNEKAGLNVSVNYNIFGKRISVVSSEDAPNAYELPRNALNISVNKQLGKTFSITLQARNLLNPEFKHVQYFKGQSYLFQNSTRGRDFSVGVNYKF